MSGRLIWGMWDDFAKVLVDPYFKAKIIGGKFALEEFDLALEEIKKGTPRKMLIYLNKKDIK